MFCFFKKYFLAIANKPEKSMCKIDSLANIQQKMKSIVTYIL